MQGTTSLRDFFEHSYRPMKLPGDCKNTPPCYLAAINGLEKFWRSQEAAARDGLSLALSDTTETLIGQFLSHVLAWKHHSRATRNKHLRHLKAIWNWGMEEARRVEEETGKHPGLFRRKLRLKKIKEEEREPECWSQEQFALLLGTAADRSAHERAELPAYVGDCPACLWWPALILMIYSTGLRINALMQLRSADLNLEAQTVKVQAETQKDRAEKTFTLQAAVCDVVRRIRPDRLLCVFEEWPHDHTPATEGTWRTLREHYKLLLVQAGLPTTDKDLFHKLRRTFCTEVAITKGETAAQELAGHSHISVTRRYIDKKKLKPISAAESITPPNMPVQLRLIKPEDVPPSAKAS
jgi:integrase